MAGSRKNDDCYFYYYSTCLKGDNCPFRHEENSLGCEVVCQYWKEGKCLNQRCSFRHMELKKNRKAIPCFWEAQPGGCRKTHCPFRHVGMRTGATEKSQDKSRDGNNGNGRSPNSDSGIVTQPQPPMHSHGGEINYTSPPVDPIVVKFEEESDNESAPTSSPGKRESVRIKSLEEIRLEKVQKEAAAYYGMQGSGEDRDLGILTLAEIRRRRTYQDNLERLEEEPVYDNLEPSECQPDSTSPDVQSDKVTDRVDDIPHRKQRPVKLRRFLKRGQEPKVEDDNQRRKRLKRTLSETPCSSTSMLSSEPPLRLIPTEDITEPKISSLDDEVDYDEDICDVDEEYINSDDILKNIDEMLCD